MATTRRIKAQKIQKEHIVPVRVVRSAKPKQSIVPPMVQARVESVEPEKKRPQHPGRRVPSSEHNRRTLMWGAVVAVMIVIVLVWILSVPGTLSRGSGSDALLSKIRTQLQDFFSSIPNLGKKNVNTEDQQLQDLRNSVFPNINDQQFSTDSANTNASTSENVNVLETITTNQNVNE